MRALIGLEIHVQLRTDRKMYCDCPTDYLDATPNTNICPICIGLPGSKPMPPNERAIDSAIEIALMLGCEMVVDKPTYIQRKHYDYPDLPSGYQRTSLPIATGGELGGVRIREVHVEEDPGQYDPVAGTVDFNRSGVPLVEIVTEPDMRSPEEARRFLRQLARTLEYTGKVRPEAGGAMRVDANISIEGGGRVEVKNINSIKGVYRALKFEFMRQRQRLERGERVERETRAFLESQGITIPMRRKEVEEDYRYIPDPDIFPIIIDQARVEAIRGRLVEAPHARERRLMERYGIGRAEASAIVSERELADLFEAVAKEVSPRLAAEWFRTRLKKVLNYMKLSAADVGFTPGQLAGLLRLVEGGELTPEQGELALRELARAPAEPEDIVRRLGLGRVSEEELRSAIDEAIRANPKAVDDYLAGKGEAIHFIAGHVMKATRKRADPREAIKLLHEKLDALRRPA